MKLSIKVLGIVLVFIMFSAYLISFQLVPSLKHRYLEETEQEYTAYLDNNLDYLNSYIRDISYDINHISALDELSINHEYYYTSYIHAEGPGFKYNPNKDEKNIAAYIEGYKTANPNIEDIFIGFEDGGFITSDPIDLIGDKQNTIYNFDPRVRPWYKKAMENPGVTIISPLYQRIELIEDTEDNDPINYYLTVARTIENEDGESVGVVGVNISLMNLLSHLYTVTKSKIESLGIFFDNDILCRLYDDNLEVNTLSTYAELVDNTRFLSDENASLSEYKEGSTYIKKSSESLGIMLFYTIDMDVIEQHMSEYLMTIISTVSSSLLFFIILILLLVQFSIVLPINKLNKVTSHISTTMDLSSKVKYKSNDEIGNLANNFNHLMSEIKTYRDNLDDLVKNRTLQLSKFGTAIEQSSAAVVITDIDGNIEYVSPKFKDITGYEYDEVIGKNPRILKSGVHAKEFYEELWDTLLRGEDWEGVFQNIDKGGETFFDRSRISPIRNEDGIITNFVAIKEDITEQKKTQEQLKNALEDNQIILESVGEGIMGITTDGKVSFANKMACSMLGYDRDEILGINIDSILHKKYDLLNLENLNADDIIKDIQDGREVRIEREILLRKCGKQFVVEISCVPIVRDDNHLGGVIVIKDLTDKLNLEASMEKIFDNMPTGFAEHELLYDENGNPFDYRFLKINNSYKSQTGVENNVIGKTVSEVLPDIHYEQLEVYDKVVKTKNPTTFETYVEFMGKYYRITAFATGGNSFATILYDITESMQSAELLKENEKRLSFIFETTPFAVVTTVKGIIYYANDNFVKMTGLDIMDSAIEAYYDPNDRARMSKMVENGEDVINFETRFYNARKEIIHVLLSVVRTNIEGQDGLLGWLMDITDLKKTEEQLIVAKEQAESATKAKSDFLANMSHEIRTPMNAVVGLNGLLKSTGLTIKQKDYVDKIERSASNLMHIINDILDFSKIESGKMSIEKIEFNVEDVIKDQISLISLEAHKKAIEIIIDKDFNVPQTLKGDPHRLGQIVGNLINNAVKFTSQGNVVIGIKRIEKIKKKVLLKFEIADTGIGMSKNQLNKLFKPFTQADTSTTRRFGGTGLGLVITKELVEMMGGEINVYSKENEGSRFEVILPFKKGSETNREYQLVENIDVLVIEENELVREVIGKYLNQFGYKYTLASSADDAASMIKYGLFDVILMHNSSWELNSVIWDKISSLYKDKEAPKIIFTQSSSDDESFDNDDMPFEVLVKPIFPSTLYDALSRSLNDKHIIRSSEDAIGEKAQDIKELDKINVLVVEDNEVNRLVVKDILKNAGVNVDEAANGLEAIEKVDAKKYDMVLMDIQMPKLDGYESTIEIRKKYTKEQLPIIALTADAVVETRNKVLEIGMNDYLSKPIDINKLYKKMMKWIKIKSAFIKPNEGKSEKENIDMLKNILYDFNVEDAVKRVGGNIEFYASLLNKYADDNVNLISGLNDSYENKDYNNFKFLIHSQKGVAGYIGADSLRELFLECEQEFKRNGANKAVRSKLYRIEKLLQNVFNEISIMNTKFKEMGILGEDAAQKEEKENMLRDIKILIHKLDKEDKSAAEIVDGLKFRIKNKNIVGMMSVIKEYIKKEDYQNAKSVAENIYEMMISLNLE